MRAAHEIVAWLLIASNAIVGAWCLGATRWPALVSRAMWAAVVVAQALASVQAVIGAALSRQAGVELNDMHALYGFSAVIAVIILYGYRSSQAVRDRQLVLYGLGSWFIMGLGLRNLFL